MVDKKMEEEVDEATDRIDEIKKAAGDFRKNVASIAKNMNIESRDWHFNVESHENGITVDVAIKMLITRKKKKK